ncbi:RagB/SusD family nutrient uptake outer membrane protein [Seonamhaeicola sp. NFXS20]|uniref:RagB/SusD family nutrient uptake outer membrane protein n=1 Tax=Seonamhaeicola sp. NFXS20 TaxID=2816959 RepID=UPI003B8CDE8E
MKKNKQHIVVLFIVVLLSAVSCTDVFDESQLDQAPEQDLDFDKVFTDYEQFREYLDYSYYFMPGHLGRLWNSLVAELSDEAEGLGVNVCSPAFNNGAWSGDEISGIGSNPVANANRELVYLWEDLFKGIRQVNTVIKNIDLVENFPSQEVYDRSLGEAYFIRAFLYFELVKRWGGVPIFDTPLELGVDELDIPRNTYEECINFIVEDCDRASQLLGVEYTEGDVGRATIGAALALKSRTLLYAARPLNNPTNDLEKWKLAAAAAWDVINLNHYSLDPDYVNMFFRPDLGSEIIMNRPRPKINFEQGHTDNSNFLVRFIVPQGYNGWMGTAVTQNFVDLYEDSNGFPITDASSNYNPNDPYANRDPRLRMTVLYNDRYWYDRNTQFYTGGLDYGSTLINPIGYSIAKFWPEAHQRYKGTSTYLNYIYFRYAEILLNYAEAVNEAYGPDGTYPGSGLTAREATTQVRQRVNQVPIPMVLSSSKETMRERIRNERAIELCFEEQRWYDVLSWEKGEEIFGEQNPIKGMKITKNPDDTFIYEPYIYETRVFKSHMHRYPIPNNEIYKSTVLEQNPGW